MIDFSQAELASLAVHVVGNKLRGEGLKLSQKEVKLEDEVTKGLLMHYLLSPFKEPEYFNFTHQSSLKFNELYSFSTEIFDDPSKFFDNSVSIAKQLYEVSTHPKIKGGELHICHFRGCVVENELVDAVGVFKTETRESFLKVEPTSDSFRFKHDKGINVHNLDKGCLIFNVDRVNGFKLCVIDNTSRKNEAQYWRNSFLNIKHASDQYNLTMTLLSLTKQFSEQPGISKSEQANLLNRSRSFLEQTPVFEKEEFEKRVLGNKPMIESFQAFEADYLQRNNLSFSQEFSISKDVINKRSRFFRSVIKLDSNFHVYIHGRPDLLVKGTDEESGMKFYKLYYANEG